MNALLVVLLIFLVVCVMLTVIAPSTLLAAIGLALTSIALSMLLYHMNATLAAVFELSVCAGLITVVFISAISLTRRYSPDQERAIRTLHVRRFIWGPVLMLIAGLGLWLSHMELNVPSAPYAAQAGEVRDILWNVRRADIIGQLLVLLSGAFGVVVLFKEWSRETKKWK